MSHEHNHHQGHDHNHSDGPTGWKTYLPAIFSFLLLIAGICADYFLPGLFAGRLRIIWYAAAYIPVGFPVARTGFRLLLKGDVFTEFTLMTLATAGAFFIGEYPEGVAVMLFYTVGEYFQHAAVSRAKRSIRALLDIRPGSATVIRGGMYTDVAPETVGIGETIFVKAGEKVPLDGLLLSAHGTFNASALTGESRPVRIDGGGDVLAGMINEDKPVEVQTTRLFGDSSLARILSLVQDATKRKARTEQFIRRFSRVYTPVVVLLAVCIILVPFFFVDDYIFRDWLYRALIFLVISCPCALVISVPLGYFGGIGAASRHGILFKGSNFLDLMTRVNTVIMDKTGTLTKGVFKVQRIVSQDMPETEWLPLASALEATSSHPVARAVVAHTGYVPGTLQVDHVAEISGHGLQGVVRGRQVLAGNLKLLQREGIITDERWATESETIVAVAIDGKAAGYISIADELKEDSRIAIQKLHKKGIETVMLSGDKQSVVDQVAGTLGIGRAFGNLLPEDKVRIITQIKEQQGSVVVFAGDGINDAPALALSDVGIAMGGLGTDVAIETADVIIQTDQPSRIAQAIDIGKATNRVVWQNISLAFGVKLIVLLLGAGGIATMWEAVFADVGVALLAILNATRIQRKQF